MARRRSALPLLALVAALAVLGSSGVAAAQTRTTSLLPLARGQLLVSLGTPPQWLPVSGRSLTVTLFSGRAKVRDAAADNAYIAFQRTSRRCAASASGDHEHLLTITAYYASRDLISHQDSTFFPGGGTASGDYQASVANVVVSERGAVQACVWLARKESSRGLAIDQRIPLLNGLFAASVSALPSSAGSTGTTPTDYTMDAVDVARAFSYSATTTQCGTRYADDSGQVADGTLGTESIAVTPDACTGDGTVFHFGGALGSLSYTVAMAYDSPPGVASLGGCELDPVAVVPLSDAAAYVQSVGCTVAGVQIAPYQSALPRGAVVAADIDGGLADVAPAGTAVDLILNGRP